MPFFPRRVTLCSWLLTSAAAPWEMRANFWDCCRHLLSRLVGFCRRICISYPFSLLYESFIRHRLRFRIGEGDALIAPDYGSSSEDFLVSRIYAHCFENLPVPFYREKTRCRSLCAGPCTPLVFCLREQLSLWDKQSPNDCC